MKHKKHTAHEYDITKSVCEKCGTVGKGDVCSHCLITDGVVVIGRDWKGPRVPKANAAPALEKDAKGKRKPKKTIKLLGGGEIRYY